MIVKIYLGHNSQDSELVLQYQVHDTPLARAWSERLAAGMSYPIDHPERFYGWNSKEHELDIATGQLLDAVNTVNSHKKIFSDPVSATDQDWLNSVHTVFEDVHGGLDQQDTEFFQTAPAEVQRALANVNVYVHAVETAVSEKSNPRFVVTRWGLPKTHLLEKQWMSQYGVVSPPWGSLVLSYVEIGKTLEDLVHDNEAPSDLGFRPWKHYSADFVARFYEEEDTVKKLNQMRYVFEWHRDWFEARGFDQFEDPQLLPLRYPVAQLIEEMPREDLIYHIGRHNRVKQVQLIHA